MAAWRRCNVSTDNDDAGRRSKRVWVCASVAVGRPCGVTHAHGVLLTENDKLLPSLSMSSIHTRSKASDGDVLLRPLPPPEAAGRCDGPARTASNTSTEHDSKRTTTPSSILRLRPKLVQGVSTKARRGRPGVTRRVSGQQSTVS